MTSIITRAYNSFQVDRLNHTIKKISSTERLANEISYYKYLNSQHTKYSCYFPRLYDYSYGEENWMTLEQYDYPNLGDFLIYDKKRNWSYEQMFDKLLRILTEWSVVRPYDKWSDEEILDSSTKMYIEKTETEQRTFVEGWSDRLNTLFGEVSINGTIYLSFDEIWATVREYIENNMLNYSPSLIHGDFCFSNILYGNRNNIFRFIDPRGSFGKVGVYGDIRYDVAKLYHSSEGKYEFFITDNFEVSNQSNHYNLTFSNNDFENINSVFEDIFFACFDKKQIKILQGCIFIGMCARHYDSIERQQAMYLTGIKLLNESLEI